MAWTTDLQTRLPFSLDYGLADLDCLDYGLQIGLQTSHSAVRTADSWTADCRLQDLQSGLRSADCMAWTTDLQTRLPFSLDYGLADLDCLDYGLQIGLQTSHSAVRTADLDCGLQT
jgi:hypothetical protein